VQILVVVANIQVRTLKAEVEKGFMGNALFHEWLVPKLDRKRVGRRQSGSNAQSRLSPRAKGNPIKISEAGLGYIRQRKWTWKL